MADKDIPTKEICHWTKSQLENHFVLLAQIVTEPKYACTKCGRAANAKKWLCKPKKLPKEE
jgi:lipopolysaccharide biosynthesis regulator YciM